MVEWLGWTATAIFVVSYFCKEAATLRRIQAFAALLWLGYGVVIQAAPVIVSNSIVVVVALYSSWPRREQEE